MPQQDTKKHTSALSALLLPFKPVIGAYGGLAQMLERLRQGVVAIAPDVNLEVTIGMARTLPGTLYSLYKRPFGT